MQVKILSTILCIPVVRTLFLNLHVMFRLVSYVVYCTLLVVFFLAFVLVS